VDVDQTIRLAEKRTSRPAKGRIGSPVGGPPGQFVEVRDDVHRGAEHTTGDADVVPTDGTPNGAVSATSVVLEPGNSRLLDVGLSVVLGYDRVRPRSLARWSPPGAPQAHNDQCPISNTSAAIRALVTAWAKMASDNSRRRYSATA
jgi:hypothetical protein